MKLFILSDDMSGSGPVWMNIFWPHYTAYADCAPTVLMSTPYRPPGPGRLTSHWHDLEEKRQHEKRLCDLVRREHDPNGPNILLVWAVNFRDIRRARLLEPVWDMFDVRVLWVLDTINPAHTKLDQIKKFDMIASICGDVRQDFAKATDLPTVYMPPHTDVLRHGTTAQYRPLDLLAVGRRDRSLYAPIHLHFNQPGQQRISVDLVTRTRNFSASAHDECCVLMQAYASSKLTFCFEPSNAHPRFRGYSPLTERWPHAWASGCTIVGSKPTGTGVAEQMDWPEATLDLPDTADEAIPYLEAVLKESDALARRRVRNVTEAARRHDSRYRLHKLFTELDLPIPQALSDGLQRLERMASDLKDAA